MSFDTTQPAQVTGLGGYKVDPFVTIGDTVLGYTPVGIPDGMGAYALNSTTVRVLLNHELGSTAGAAYKLANGTSLTGARVSYFDIDKATLKVVEAGLAYDRIINRAGEVVDAASDLEFGGIQRLCSAQYVEAGQFSGRGIVDGLFFTGEETNGGTQFVVDPKTKTMYAVPWMGRAGWENVTQLDTGSNSNVAFLIGDDRSGAPLLLYVGQKDTKAGAGLLERNGLANGKLYVWTADNGNLDPSQFKGTGKDLNGKFVEIDFYRPDLKGTTGYDSLGFATQTKQDELARTAKAFQFSRPEDLATNPFDGTQAVLASTGSSIAGGADLWGTTYRIDVDFTTSGIKGNIKILYNGDDAGAGKFAAPDFGLRSPDNLDWAGDGFIYINEDRSVDGFGAVSGEEASIWKLNPNTGDLSRIAKMDRTAVPAGQTDTAPLQIGNWETSGILDVSSLFGKSTASLFISNVQGHSLRGGPITTGNLVEGGQLFFMSAPASLPQINGGAGNDTLFGTGAREQFNGGEGNNTLFGNGGNDLFIAGAGNDQAYGGGGDDSFELGGGNNVAYGNGGNDTFITGLGNDTIYGGGGNDVVDAGNGDNVIYGNGGNDRVRTGAGKDTIYGGGGNEYFSAGDGDNTIYGNGGNDTFITGSGKDTIYGGGGNDVISAGNGDNLIYGNGGNDSIITGSGNDLIYGGGSNETFNTGTGEDVIYSNGGADILFLNAGAGAVTFFGWSSDDRLSRGSGISTTTALSVNVVGSDTQILAGTDLLATLKWVQLGAVPAIV
jgi:serralysin